MPREWKTGRRGGGGISSAVHVHNINTRVGRFFAEAGRPGQAVANFDAKHRNCARTMFVLQVHTGRLFHVTLLVKAQIRAQRTKR